MLRGQHCVGKKNSVLLMYYFTYFYSVCPFALPRQALAAALMLAT